MRGRRLGASAKKPAMPAEMLGAEEVMVTAAVVGVNQELERVERWAVE